MGDKPLETTAIIGSNLINLSPVVLVNPPSIPAAP